MQNCAKCGGRLYPSLAHRCPLRWVVWDIGIGASEREATTEIYTRAAVDAAEKWAERYLSKDEATTVCVKSFNDYKRGGPVHKFKVTAEQTTVYHAEPVQE